MVETEIIQIHIIQLCAIMYSIAMVIVDFQYKTSAHLDMYNENQAHLQIATKMYKTLVEK